MSRLQQAKKAVRPALPARAMFSGPPGSGKTRTALIVATILAEGGPILVFDTEKESALTYADDFDFTHVPWEEPYEPRELGRDIIDAGRDNAVIIVDSASHFWRGKGGVLDIADGKFTGWKDARPAQLDLVDSILACRAHVLVCARSKVEHVQEPNGKGGFTVKKLGMAAIQDDDLEYEMNVAIEIDMTHALNVAKSRAIAVPVGRTFTAGHADQFAEIYRDWLKGGEPPAPQAAVDELVARIGAMGEARRKACKAEFFATFGKPDHLRETQLRDARVLVGTYESQTDDEFDESGGGGESGESPRVDDEPPVTAAPATTSSGGDGGAPPAASPPGEEPAAGECDLEDLAALMASTGLAEGKVLTRARRLAKTNGLEQPTAFDGLAPGRLLDLLVEWLGQQPEIDPTPDGSDTGSHPDGGGADTPPTEGTRPASAAGNGDGHEPGTSAPSEQVGVEATGAKKAPPNQRRYFAVAGKAAKTAGCDPETLRDRLASIVSGGSTTSATGFTDALWCDMADMAQTIIDGPDELYQRATGEWTVGRRPVGRQVPRQRPRSAA